MRSSVLVAAMLLLIGPVVVVGVVVGPPATQIEPSDESSAWLNTIEYAGPGAWLSLFKLEDSSAVFLYTRQDVVRSGSVVSVWRRIEFRGPQPAATLSTSWTGTYLSLVERVDLNCDNPSERVRSATAYRGRNMTDPIQPPLVFDEGQSRWQPAVSGTERALFASRLCSLFQTRGMHPY